MNKVIIYTRPDGGMSIVRPGARGQVMLVPARTETLVTGYRKVKAESGDMVEVPLLKTIEHLPVYRDETDDEFLERVARQSVPPNCAWRVENADNVPTDRTFRNAWRDEDGRIGCCMKTARDIHRDRIRIARKPMLESLDVEYQRADEAGVPARKSEIARQKQALRDAPADPRIEAAKTPDDLKKVWPL